MKQKVMSQTQLTEYNETNMVIQQLMITNRHDWII